MGNQLIISEKGGGCSNGAMSTLGKEKGVDGCLPKV